jgi:uncharacterized protein YoxC
MINTILLSLLLVLACAFAGVGIWASLEIGRASRSLRTLSDDLDERAMPLLEKADITVDALNAELLRVDTIVSRIEDITDRVESTSRTVQEVASAPGEIVNDIADRVRRAWKRRQAESAEKAAQRDAEYETEPESEATTEMLAESVEANASNSGTDSPTASSV